MPKLYDLAHCRAGDKGNTSILSLVAYRAEDYPLLVERVTADAVARHLAGIVLGSVRRFELPGLHALQFVCEHSPAIRPVVCNACAVTYDIACNGDALALRFVDTWFPEPILPANPCLCRLMCKERHRMATNLALDPDLIELAVKVSGERTKKAAVTRALEEFIARRSQKRLVDLMGKLEWDETFDYKVERSRR